MDKRTTPAVTVGIASLLTIFAVLCLAMFALLSVSTARSNQRIAMASRQAITDYYRADGEAQAILARQRRGETVGGEQQAGDTYAYRCEISPTSALEVEVTCSGSDYELLRYQVVSTGAWNAEENIPVWDGQ